MSSVDDSMRRVDSAELLDALIAQMELEEVSGGDELSLVQDECDEDIKENNKQQVKKNS